ncbi:FGGY family carbohydrate kinase [Faecalicatena acetigenes]|uniref:FGGY family carbohydrate kinase n=1 Tax=Faecalicatena acetigenes TaxID=2981790 RepID=A0ABT2TF13_9FIRM|nr:MULTISPECIES: FGGY-family carbohydrate kinase [Lachnospiraceae]MCU6748376.1 FGGY family carbohydrate kinase [Faecalicatena acetigenes]SCI40655.1 Glycerol kinase [uncultured Clostridium sp.]
MNIAVIDVGTSSIRGILYNNSGKILHMHQIRYQVQYINETFAEKDPEEWKCDLYAIGKNLSEWTNEHHIHIDGLSLTSQRSTVIPVDKNAVPLSQAIMWMDKRNTSIGNELKHAEKLISEKTGARINDVFSGSKMTWIKRNQPEIYASAYKILTVADYFALLMTGEFKTDHTYGSRSSLMNIRTRQWDDELLKLFEIEKGKLCDLISPGEVLGTTTEDFFHATGIMQGTPLISAGGDQQCAALGLGIIKTGDMELTTGTGAFLLAYSDKVPDNLEDNVICGAHAEKGKYVLESSILSCCSLYDWFKNQFYVDTTDYDLINQDILQSVPGSNGCTVLPYFQGRGTPDWNADASGCFLNLTLRTTRQDMARSILESIAMETANNIDVLENYVGYTNKIHISGGLTNFSAFNQIQADVYQKELIKSKNPEQTSLGGLINALIGLGYYTDYQSALNAVKKEEKSVLYVPDKMNASLYKEKRLYMNKMYKKLYS